MKMTETVIPDKPSALKKGTFLRIKIKIKAYNNVSRYSIIAKPGAKIIIILVLKPAKMGESGLFNQNNNFARLQPFQGC